MSQEKPVLPPSFAAFRQPSRKKSDFDNTQSTFQEDGLPSLPILCFGAWKLNSAAHHLIGPTGLVVSLSAAEYRLLIFFLRHPQQVLTRDQLMEHTAFRTPDIFDRSLGQAVAQLIVDMINDQNTDTIENSDMKRKWVRRMISGFILIVVVLVAAGYAYLHTAKFGALPAGERLEKIQNSPNYKDGEFKNIEPIPVSTEKSSVPKQLMNYLSAKKDRPRPPSPIPTVKTNLMDLDRNEDIVIWLGHSSFYLQLAGQRILIDPVLSEDAAPIPWVNEAFTGTNIYSASDFPEIDILLITHDHWDHLDYPTIISLKEKVAKIISPLGVGAHFERWGFPENSVVETDWQQALPLDNGLVIHTLPARHYSGRTLTRNKTLWAAYALITPEHKIYISGDSGYGSHFQEAGKAFGGFDLAVLDSGQYNERWRYVHMMPEDAVKATAELNAKALLPAHAGKFSIAYHAWDEPFVRLKQAVEIVESVKATQENSFELLTPKIGEPVRFDAGEQHFSPWWTNKTEAPANKGKE